MVLLAAYGNFQDRIVLGLNLPMEPDGPLAPIDVKFGDKAFQIAAFVPPQSEVASLIESGKSVVAEDPEWSRLSYDDLQKRLEGQRDRQPRLPVPVWEDVKKNLPEAMAARPTRIVWNLVCSGYVPELAVPWSISTRTMWSESKPDRVLEESLFWIQTRSIECNYCMGHCEMLLEVAGLDKTAIAERTRRLASKDWSAFPPEEQRAYAYARKLSKTPWELTAADYKALEADFGPDKAMATFWWLCRGLYMTRVSDGFQLPLERDNVFMDYMRKQDAVPAKSDTRVHQLKAFVELSQPGQRLLIVRGNSGEFPRLSTIDSSKVQREHRSLLAKILILVCDSAIVQDLVLLKSANIVCDMIVFTQLLPIRKHPDIRWLMVIRLISIPRFGSCLLQPAATIPAVRARFVDGTDMSCMTLAV